LFDNLIKNTGIIIARITNIVKTIGFLLLSGTSHKIDFNFSIIGPSQINEVSTHDSLTIKKGTPISKSDNPNLFQASIISVLFSSLK